MIFDCIENLDKYVGLSVNFDKAANYIKTENLSELPLGKHNIVDEDVFVIVSEYQTKEADQCMPEAHEKYIDIQILIEGEELIGYAPLKKQKLAIEYNAENDVVFYHSKTNKFKLLPGEFAVFFPHDIHQPGIISKSVKTVKKAVFKIKVQ